MSSNLIYKFSCFNKYRNKVYVKFIIPSKKKKKGQRTFTLKRRRLYIIIHYETRNFDVSSDKICMRNLIYLNFDIVQQ